MMKAVKAIQPSILICASLFFLATFAPLLAQINPEEEEFYQSPTSTESNEIMSEDASPPATSERSSEASKRPDQSLLDRLTPEVIAAVFAGVDAVKIVVDDGPSAAAAFASSEMVGYIFSTLDVLRAPGYSSIPFDVIAGVTLEGTITGAVVLFHQEPYLLNDSRRTAQLITFLTSLEGLEGRLGAEGGLKPSFVAGATISARAMRNAVLEGARMVVRYRSEEIIVTEPTVDTINFKPLSTQDLVRDGGLAYVHITNQDLFDAMKKAGLFNFLPQIPVSGGPGNTYIEFVVGYANPPKIGRNGMGQEPYNKLMNEMGDGTEGVFVATLHGVYDHRGTKFNNLSNQFRLDRITMTQGDRIYDFAKSDVIFSLGQLADILMLPPNNEFDPMEPWRVDLHAFAQKPDGSSKAFILAGLDYDLPKKYILMPEPTRSAAWLEPWKEGQRDIAILCGALLLLTAIFIFQDKLNKKRSLHRLIRNGFLTFTLIWIGWIAGAQLSIVHLINYLSAPFQNLSFTFYLTEPLIVIISIYTAVSLILLGRGVFCGWLCPFGALQELLGQAARAIHLPQWNPSQKLQSSLWYGKYASLAVILFLVVVDPSSAAIAEEVEPFKTAITAIFIRGLPYVLYATALLVIGLFTERAFCRFLCPLGGALAIFDRLHLLDRLKRRPECGSPCHLCEHSCPVRAIEKTGKIKMAECFQCLDCQVEYYDDHRCPPLAKIRKSLERMSAHPSVPTLVPLKSQDLKP